MYYNTTILFADKSAPSAEPRRIKHVSVFPVLFNLNDRDHNYGDRRRIHWEH